MSKKGESNELHEGYCGVVELCNCKSGRDCVLWQNSVGSSGGGHATVSACGEFVGVSSAECRSRTCACYRGSH